MNLKLPSYFFLLISTITLANIHTHTKEKKAVATTLTIPIVDDILVEATTMIGTTSNATITIAATNDSVMNISDVTISEDAGSASVSVSINTPSSFDTTVAITTVDNSAIEPDDYIFTLVTVTIPAGQLSVNVSIPITDDNIGEPTEDFTVNGTVTSGNTINSSDSGTVTINDDDTPAMTIGDVTVNEDDGSANVPISITNPSVFDTVISILSVNGTATNFNDYTLTTPALTIPAGQTSVSLSIPIVDDLDFESTEEFDIQGTVVTGNTSNASDTGTVTIIDNDPCTSNPTTDCDGDGVTNGDEQNPPNGGTPTNPDFSCDYNPSDVTLPVSADFLAEDCDGDGTLNAVDCDPLDGLVTQGFGDTCDDGDPLTLSDFLDENCNCIGLATADADGDGIPNTQEAMDGTDYNDACDPIQNTGYTGYDANNSIWQNANCDNDDINNALEIILGSDPYDTNYNTIQGSLTFDVNGDGCNGTDDLVFPNTSIAISDGTNTTTVFTNNTGNYSYNATIGTYTLTPNIENPTFFTITPLNASTSFSSTDNSVFNQDFCITNNGVNPDVEVVIAPIAFARPGFDAEYLLTYRNKGNQTVSGTVNFAYDDAVLDFVSSTPMTSSQATGILNWNYTNLAPFQSRSINITLNVNPPTATPPVNNGDQLSYTATITSTSGDVFSDDNQFDYTQTVVGSYDPNDITCVEGSSVSPDDIGKDLHYIINFENTGTFFAENIVVEMNIDPTEFDISTLQLLSSSHNASVTINGTMVRFIFQNIFLPVDGQGNILIKMKTQNTLVENDIVSNQASIFFDFNFPIITNIADTTFAVLSTSTFETDSSITIFPNPTKNNIQITADKTIINITLYDMQGRILVSEKHNHKEVNLDISNQASGVYFIQINTEKGVNTEKIIKL